MTFQLLIEITARKFGDLDTLKISQRSQSRRMALSARVGDIMLHLNTDVEISKPIHIIYDVEERLI